MNDQATKYRARAAMARTYGDPYSADWLDEQAANLDAARDERERAAEYDALKRHGHE